MERESVHFARRVLFWHGVAFLVLLILAGVGTWNAYSRSTREAVNQAGMRQQLVAQQTARGIENFFAAILDNLRLITRDELRDIAPVAMMVPGVNRAPGDAGTPGAQHDPQRQGHPIIRGAAGRMVAMSFLSAVWKQIEDRSTHLIAVNLKDGQIIRCEQRPNSLPAEVLVKPGLAKLRENRQPAISDRLVYEGFSYVLVSVPFSDAEQMSVVAVVPLDEISQRFIDGMTGNDKTISALLFDTHATVISAKEPELVGVNFEKDATDPAFKDLVMSHRARRVGGIDLVENVRFAGGQMIHRGVVAVEPVKLPDGMTWYLSVGANLSDVGGLVNEIFRGTLLWTPILIVLFAGVMVSTAATLIRNRSRLERLRLDVLRGEIEQARHIQLSWLPPAKFGGRGIAISAINKPASHVSGDFYNYFALPDGREAVVVGDVTGHGMAAAFLMSTTQLLVRSLLMRTLDPVATVNEINRELCGQAFSGQFVTLLLIVIDQEQGVIDVVNAGHPPPLMIDDGTVRQLPTSPQLVLGVEPDVNYEHETFPFRGACSMLLYTDGVVECREPAGERYSIEQLVVAMNGVTEEPDGVIERMLDAIDGFRKTEPLTDDATALAIRVHDEAGMTAEDPERLAYSV